MSRADAGGNRCAQYAGKIGAATGCFRSRFNHVKDWTGTAALSGPRDIEVDADDGFVFKNQPA